MVEPTHDLTCFPAASPGRQSDPLPVEQGTAGKQGNGRVLFYAIGAAILQLVRDSVELQGAVFVRADPNSSKMEEAPRATATVSELGHEPWHGVDLRA